MCFLSNTCESHIRVLCNFCLCSVSHCDFRQHRWKVEITIRWHHFFLSPIPGKHCLCLFVCLFVCFVCYREEPKVLQKGHRMTGRKLSYWCFLQALAPNSKNWASSKFHVFKWKNIILLFNEGISFHPQTSGWEEFLSMKLKQYAQLCVVICEAS